MKRMQIQFTEEQARRLRQAAGTGGESISSVVRRAVDAQVAVEDSERRWERALGAVGRFRSGTGANLSEDHDRHLAEIYGSS
jgi:Arc/MetJ-type ribon-helix-helix transcriptional regulator